MFNEKQVQKKLDACQKGCKARLVTMEEVKHFISLAEARISDIPIYVLKHITFEYIDGVPGAYKYRGESTKVTFTFTQKGTVKDIEFARARAPSISYGGEQRRLVLDFLAMFRAEFDFGPGSYEQSLMIKRFISFLGFNQHGTVVL